MQITPHVLTIFISLSFISSFLVGIGMKIMKHEHPHNSFGNHCHSKRNHNASKSSNQYQLKSHHLSKATQLTFDFLQLDLEFFRRGGDKYLEHVVIDLIEKINGVLLTHRCFDAANHGKLETCIGMMEDGHVIVRSSPTHQTCMLDLYISNMPPLNSIVADVRSLFIPKDDSPSIMKWACKLRASKLGNYPDHSIKKGNLVRALSSEHYELKQKVVCLNTQIINLLMQSILTKMIVDGYNYRFPSKLSIKILIFMI